MTVYKYLHELAPIYLVDDCHSISAIAGKQHLRSADTGTLFVPRTTTTLGMRSFAVAGPHIWNSLPAAFRTATLSPLAFTRHLDPPVWLGLFRTRSTNPRIIIIICWRHSLYIFNSLGWQESQLAYVLMRMVKLISSDFYHKSSECACCLCTMQASCHCGFVVDANMVGQAKIVCPNCIRAMCQLCKKVVTPLFRVFQYSVFNCSQFVAVVSQISFINECY